MPAMDFEVIDRLKREYTDKYVVADAKTPELARFRGLTGQVKTVNMSGRALVEFEGNNNIGWYDIGLSFLKIVDKPAPKAKETAEEKKANPAAKGKATAQTPAVSTGEKKMSPIEMARAQAAAKKGGEGATAAPAKPAAPAAGKPSTADILAAARAKKEGGAPAATAPAATPAPTPAAKPAAPAAGGKMSVADILAAARGKSAPAAAAPAKVGPAEAKASPAAPKAEPPKPAAPAPVAAAPKPEPAPAPVEKKAAPAGKLPKDVPGILAFCREHDGK